MNLSQQFIQACNSKNPAGVVEICRRIEQQVAQQAISPHEAMELFATLCGPELVAYNHYEYDHSIMHTAGILHGIVKGPIDVQCVLNIAHNNFYRCGQPSTPHSALLCALINRQPQWTYYELETMYYTFAEMAGNLHEAENRSAVGAIEDFLQLLRANTTTHVLLYRMLAGLLYDNAMGAYAHILPCVEVSNLVQICIEKFAFALSLLERLDQFIDEPLLQQWFPHNDAHIRAIAREYPRLLALVERRNLLEHVQQPDLCTARKL